MYSYGGAGGGALAAEIRADGSAVGRWAGGALSVSVDVDDASTAELAKLRREAPGSTESKPECNEDAAVCVRW